MATLTWRDVAAPSFGGVNEAYRTSAAQLSQALSGLSDGIKQFQAQRQAGIDAGILGRAMQIQDPAQMREALASGSLLQGVDLSKINPKILANWMSVPVPCSVMLPLNRTSPVPSWVTNVPNRPLISLTTRITVPCRRTPTRMLLVVNWLSSWA